MRGGASALAKWGTDGSDPFAEFRSATFDELRERGKKRDEKKEVGIKLEIGDAVSEEQKRQLELEEEQAEKLLLQGREAVQARKFEGATYKATNIEIRNEWQATLARSSNERTVMIDGHPVLKETLVRSLYDLRTVRVLMCCACRTMAAGKPSRRSPEEPSENLCRSRRSAPNSITKT